MQQDLQDTLKSATVYDKLTGAMFFKGKQVFPDYQGFVVLYIDKKLVKLKIEKLACLVGLGRLPEKNERVLHKNLDTNDLRLCNLSIVNKGVFAQVKEAKLNLDGCLCLVPHDTDQFCYWLCYREKSIHKRELIHDIVSAKKAMRRKKIQYTKMLMKFCVFD